ncbi:hypothetical protein GCM10025783_30100 [Amnibacterium soli]|uniref:Uncharacterized protein n=1 Tax=Amnibacterium soli TaxID=1282736 RepID=A0ABP8ZF16_9MICO
MLLLKLAVADLPNDDRDSPTRTVWVNPLQIETVVEYVTWNELDPLLWLELTLASGAVLYNLVGPVAPTELMAAAEHAVEHLLSA